MYRSLPAGHIEDRFIRHSGSERGYRHIPHVHSIAGKNNLLYVHTISSWGPGLTLLLTYSCCGRPASRQGESIYYSSCSVEVYLSQWPESYVVSLSSPYVHPALGNHVSRAEDGV